MIRPKHISTSARFSAFALLASWSLVVGLEFMHQVGHMLSGCPHHTHHGEHALHQEDCSTWEGAHDDSRLVKHAHVCELCDWKFSLEVPSLTSMASKYGQTWRTERGNGEVTPGHAQQLFWTTTGRRGPPHCG